MNIVDFPILGGIKDGIAQSDGSSKRNHPVE